MEPLIENYTVAFIDDEINILNSLRRALFKEKFKKKFFTEPTPLLEELEKDSSIAVVVSDLRMPQINGLELLEQISKTYPTSKKRCHYCKSKKQHHFPKKSCSICICTGHCV